MKCEVCKVKKAEMEFNMPISDIIFRADTCINCGLLLHDYPAKIIAILKVRIKKLGLHPPLPFGEMNRVAMTKTADIKKSKKVKK